MPRPAHGEPKPQGQTDPLPRRPAVGRPTIRRLVTCLIGSVESPGRKGSDPERGGSPVQPERRGEGSDPELGRAVGLGVPTIGSMDAPARHLRLLTETIAAVNSTLDLEEVLALVARKVAEALGAEACFVYLYDEAG